MIFDHINNWESLPLTPALREAFQFIRSLNALSELGDYPLRGESVFARVLEYETKPSDKALCEAHRRYVDIQSTLRGSEDIEWFYGPDLDISQPYDPEKDVELYRKPAAVPAARISNVPGVFTLLHPTDAHSPGITSPGASSAAVKKVVVKIEVELLKP